MTIEVGDALPQTRFRTMTSDGPIEIGNDFFSGKTVALFAVPGAFTPTCSARHLPGYVDKASQLKASGIDVIACTAVNDVFVLDAWAKANRANDITMLADGTGAFAESIGLAMDGAKFGMGLRSRRYAMLVDDGIVRQLHVEVPGEFGVSSAEHLLGELSAK